MQRLFARSLTQQAFSAPPASSREGAGAAQAVKRWLPFRAGVLTQGAGHFAQVVQHGSAQGSLAGVVQEAAHVRSCTRGDVCKTGSVNTAFSKRLFSVKSCSSSSGGHFASAYEHVVNFITKLINCFLLLKCQNERSSLA